MRGVGGVTRFNAFATVAKLLPLLLLVLVGLVAMRWSNLAWHGAPSGAAVSRASVLLIFAFLGVESALVPSGEVQDPARTVPRAIFIAMAVVACCTSRSSSWRRGCSAPRSPATRRRSRPRPPSRSGRRGAR